AERSIFAQKAQEEVRIWERKLHDFDTKVQAGATDAKASVSKDLNDAWVQTKTASARLETAGEKDWDSAKASFQTASHKLAVAWQKLNPADKSASALDSESDRRLPARLVTRNVAR